MARLRKREVAMLGVLALAVIGYCLIVLVYNPVAREAASLKDTVALKQAEVDLNWRRAITYDQKMKEIEKLKASLDTMWRSVAPSADIPGIVKMIDTAGAMSDISVDSVRPSTAVEKSAIGEITLTLYVQGSYGNVIAFCRMLEFSRPAIAITSVWFETIGTTGEGSTVSVRLIGKTFYRVGGGA